MTMQTLLLLRFLSIGPKRSIFLLSSLFHKDLAAFSALGTYVETRLQFDFQFLLMERTNITTPNTCGKWFAVVLVRKILVANRFLLPVQPLLDCIFSVLLKEKFSLVNIVNQLLHPAENLVSGIGWERSIRSTRYLLFGHLSTVWDSLALRRKQGTCA